MDRTDKHTDEEIRKIYNFKNIAVIGMSRDPAKAAHFVPKYMIERGFNVIPVNPSAVEILGRRTYSRVSDIKSQVDILDVFRPSEDVYPIVEDSIRKRGIRVIWLQEGIHNSDAKKIARDNNIEFVFNRCIMAEHMRLFDDK
ncbi:MAG: CoA-binding protein [Nitrosopumilales archaeon]|nr:MAG: CoA-binding protein [Nitrosopumilales archaeon]